MYCGAFAPAPSQLPPVFGGQTLTPKVAGPVHRAVFDKFIPYASAQGVTIWNGVSANLLNQYAGYLDGQGYAHKTLVNALTTLKQAFKWLVQQGHLQAKPIELPLRKAESDRAYCYRTCEVRAMIEHCQAVMSLRWLGEVIVALACTGLRIAELASLRWTDLNLEDGQLTLTDETGRPATEKRKRRELKSGRSRSFPIHPDLLRVLREMPHLDGYVFHGPRSGLLKPDTLRRILVREVLQPLVRRFPTLGDAKGFGDARLHSFRHYFCSTCANNRVHERMVMEWLGHADSEMVRHYYHLHDEEARCRMAAVDFIEGAGGRSAGDVLHPLTKNNEEAVEPDSASVPEG